MTRNKLVLFDIDHTLLDVGSVHGDSFAEAFNEVYGFDGYKDMKYAGYTDLQIFYDVISRNKLDADEKKIAMLIQSAIKHFGEKDLSQTKLLYGVLDLLESLKPHAVLGLVTGNIEEIAYMKLRHMGIGGYFLVGGFGHSSPKRADLVEAAFKEGEKRFGISKNDVFIIGDTVHDITAAHHAGVKAIGVATGRYSMEELKAENPMYVAADLTDKKIAEMIING